MEGSQGGCTPTHQGVRIFLAEQRRAQSTYKTIAATPYSRWEMGEYFHGLHHRYTYSSG